MIYDAKDMVEIETQKKERLIEKQKSMSHKRRLMCCTISSFPGGSRALNGGVEANGELNTHKKKSGLKGRRRSMKSNMLSSHAKSECIIF